MLPCLYRTLTAAAQHPQLLPTAPRLDHHILPARRLLLAVPPRARHLPIVDRRAHLNEQR